MNGVEYVMTGLQESWPASLGLGSLPKTGGFMKRVVSSVIAISLCACSADPGYEPRYEPQERLVEAQPEPQPQTTTSSIEAPSKLVSALQLCADRFAPKLPKTAEHYAIMYDVNVDGNGITAKVKDSQITGTELESCLTKVLERMEITESMVSTSRVSPKSRSVVGVVQAAAAPIALLPIILVAGGFTILLGVTIYVAVEAVEDVIEAVRKYRPKPTLNRCLDAAAGGGILWENLCNAFSDSVDRAECWDKNLRSEQMKRNWCFAKFGK